MSKAKKQKQLGMNPGTASNRLVKDILFSFVQQNGHVCHHCQKEMTREDFSIEHIKPWLDSDDPVRLYFDLNNIAFSHISCNSSAARQNKNLKHPSEGSYKRGCRCAECKTINKLKMRRYRKIKNG